MGHGTTSDTGWTRKTWTELADRLLSAVRPHAVAGNSLLALPGPPSRSGAWSDGLEGFARTFLLAGFRLAADASDPDGLAEFYATGLVNGTDPASPHRWPRFTEVTQAKVEAASIAIALHETRHVIWDRLDDSARQRVVGWFADILGDPIWENNWTWFQAIIEAFLRSVGGPWSRADLDRTLERTESWYVGDGWYSDGTDRAEGLRNFDYYNGWALHFYPLWYCRMSGADTEAGLLDRYRMRLRRHLADAVHLIAADGAPLHQGRSLTYRFAMLAPFWAGAVFDASPLAPGATRGLASRVVQHFLDAGSFDADGLLTLGWYRPFPAMRQPYSGPGSPYWASKAFAGLVLPADHPVWTDEERQPAVLDRDLALPRPGWLVSTTAADGIVRLAAHGPDHSPPHHPGVDEPEYARHGYSTHAAPEVGLTDPLDSHIALLTAQGQASARRPVTTLRVRDRVAVSRSRAHWLLSDPPQPWVSREPGDWRLGPTLTTAALLHGPWEVRLARVDPIGRPEPLTLRFGGWALAADEPPQVRIDGNTVTCHRADGLTSIIAGRHGLDRAGVRRGHERNPIGPESATPWLATPGPVEFGRVYAALVVLTGVEVDLDVAVELTADEAVVTWPDGQTDRLSLNELRPE